MSNFNSEIDRNSQLCHYIEAYVTLMDDFCDKFLKLHPHITLKDIGQWRERFDSMQIQYLRSVATEASEADRMCSVSKFVFHRTNGGAAGFFWLFSAAKNDIINLCGFPKEFSSRLDQIHSLLSFFVAALNDASSYYREVDEENLFSVIKLWLNLQCVKSEKEAYSWAKWQLARLRDTAEHLLSSFAEDYCHIKGVKEHIRDLKYGLVGFMYIQLYLKRYMNSPFLLHPVFGNEKPSKVKEESNTTLFGCLQDMSQMFVASI